MKAIVAIDKLWGIGNKGELLYYNKEDMKFFKKMTTNKVVVMGRKTYESLPNKEPLKDRINLVITSKGYTNHDNVVFGDFNEINEEIKKYDTNDIFIIGGQSIYEQFIHRCDTIYVTHNTIVCKSDAYMPNLAFEGFTFKNAVYKDHDLIIGKWITSECEPYKAVLWFKDLNNSTVFLYTNDMLYWRGIYSNTLKDITKQLREKIMLVLSLKDEFIFTKIHDYYRAEINNKYNEFKIRIASFGGTEAEASQNLMIAILKLLE